MQDLQTSLAKLRADAVDADLIAKLATDQQKRELYARLAEHFNRLADEVEAAIASRSAS